MSQQQQHCRFAQCKGCDSQSLVVSLVFCGSLSEHRTSLDVEVVIPNFYYAREELVNEMIDASFIGNIDGYN